MEETIIQIALILFLGIACQWVAWRLRIPSILILLAVGFISGPILNWVHPEALLGSALTPLVSLSVGIILFEGGMTLKLSELRRIGPVVRNLNSISVVVTWGIVTAAAYYILQLSLPLAALLGGILTVTGPTVIGPLLRHVGNVGAPGTILKWEGILIDPIGATLGLLVFEAILNGTFQSVIGNGVTEGVSGFLKTAFIGTGAGVMGAWISIQALRRYLIPDYLQNPFVLMLVIAIFALSNMLQHESGILATTIMGIMIANAKGVDTSHILEFKETLSILLISALFIVLAAGLDLAVLSEIDGRYFGFLAVLLFIARPAAVAVATIGSDLSWRERLFIAWLAPRGIVAAAVTSLFAFQLVEAGYAEAQRLVPIIFFVIVGTVTVYGLTAVPLSRWLKLVKEYPTGFLIAGAHLWARDLGALFQKYGHKVILVDSNPDNIAAAEAMGLRAIQGNILAEQVEEQVEFEGVESFLALTANDEINSLAALNYAHVFDKQNVYQLAPMQIGQREDEATIPANLRGTTLFGERVTARQLRDYLEKGSVLADISIAEETSSTLFHQQYPDAVALFIVHRNGRIEPVVHQETVPLVAGQTIIALVTPKQHDEMKVSDAALPSAMP
jgi:NhaP-type Na+/H+ or K+/H+ antiporter/Trk K+ transport system NAD-binding subunit